MVVAPAAAEMLLAVGKRRLAVEGQLMGVGMLLALGKRLSAVGVWVAAAEKGWAQPVAGTKLQPVSNVLS